MSDRSDFGHELQALGFEHTVKDVVVGLYDAKGQKYAMEQDFSVDNLKAFAQEYLDGGLEPYLKSEPVPKDNDGPVKVTVAHSHISTRYQEIGKVFLFFPRVPGVQGLKWLAICSSV